MASKKKTVVIGIDGCPLFLLQNLCDKGKLPNISHLMEEGICGKLKSTNPPVSFPAWKSYATGSNPESMGVFNFVDINLEKGDFRFNDSRSVQLPEIWDVLGEHDKRSLVVNMPGTTPPYEIPGVLVSGPFSDSLRTFPRRYSDKIISEIGEVKINPQHSRWEEFYKPREWLKEAYKCIKDKFRLAKLLLNNEKFDFLHLTIFHIDGIFHQFWSNEASPEKEVMKGLKLIDEGIGEIYTPDYNFFIISDHGHFPVRAQMDLNKWLVKRDFLKISENGSFVERIAELLNLTRQRIGKNPWIPILRACKKISKGSGLPNKNLRRSMSWLIQNMNPESKSIANTGGSIHINRKRIGQDYEKFKQSIERELQEIHIPGSKTSFNVKQKDSADPFAPDLVLLPPRGAYTADGIHLKGNLWSLKGEIYDAQGCPLMSDHTREGTLIASGPELKKDKSISADITDVMPTILHLLGCCIPEKVDGEVLDIFGEGTEPKKRGTTYERFEHERKYAEGEGEELIKKRLEELGYF
ncbi:hypothetical protein AKJ45_00270 [candidate division MSBL1 archaeon SCGC-AAA261F19]|uniref:Nucleotide pyrophosphatase n=1 Tax=candidate division MSBL1 archaeon SCGC-AAA261F19 TaxID=1698275 RepID=A0A133VBL2_9EURY|nr:hypothetical protein AKJ45_00270 [candidate division MSBL1 archaeon SCGC-AAA261F19]